MSENNSGNTGRLPDQPNDTNAFQNVNMGENVDGYANNAPVPPPNMENSANSSASSENKFLSKYGESFATAEPIPIAEPPVTVAKTGRPLSAAQSDLQRLRSETLDDMRAKYAERFGNSSVYPKPPKAKVYHASGLTTIRQRDGEAAYNAALKDIMDKNDPMLGTNGKSQLTLTRKSKKARANVTVNAPRNNSFRTNAPPVNNAANRGATNAMTASIKEMGATAKQLIDAMINTNNLMVQQLSKTGNTAVLTQLSNTVANISAKAKKPRARASTKKAPLSAVPEENSANAFNATQ
jgi:hypothetical protein